MWLCRQRLGARKHILAYLQLWHEFRSAFLLSGAVATQDFVSETEPYESLAVQNRNRVSSSPSLRNFADMQTEDEQQVTF